MSGPGGFVSLVGAGPGDPITSRRRPSRRLREADVVLYDALVGDRGAGARRDAPSASSSASAPGACKRRRRRLSG